MHSTLTLLCLATPQILEAWRTGRKLYDNMSKRCLGGNADLEEGLEE